jgi:hypothetical protein
MVETKTRKIRIDPFESSKLPVLNGEFIMCIGGAYDGQFMLCPDVDEDTDYFYMNDLPYELKESFDDVIKEEVVYTGTLLTIDNAEVGVAVTKTRDEGNTALVTEFVDIIADWYVGYLGDGFNTNRLHHSEFHVTFLLLQTLVPMKLGRSILRRARQEHKITYRTVDDDLPF